MRTPMLLVEDRLEGLGVGDVVALDDRQQHHLRRVLRRRDGDELVVGDGRGRRAAAALAGDAAELVEEVELVHAPTPAIVVAHALPKGRGLDEVVRTLAELGVARVDPVVTARTTSRPDGDRAARVAERWRDIARSAAEQAHSAHVCEVGTPVPLAAYVGGVGREGRLSAGVVDETHEVDEVLVVAEPAARSSLGAVLAGRPPPARVRLLVGPEGGFTDDELSELEAGGWELARAGDTVLRSVHAATVLVAATLALVGRYGGRGR